MQINRQVLLYYQIEKPIMFQYAKDWQPILTVNCTALVLLSRCVYKKCLGMNWCSIGSKLFYLADNAIGNSSRSTSTPTRIKSELIWINNLKNFLYEIKMYAFNSLLLFLIKIMCQAISCLKHLKILWFKDIGFRCF